MSTFSAREFRAIRVFCEARQATPQLTVYPEVRARINATGELVSVNIAEVLREYDDHRAEAARMRAEKRKGEPQA